MKSACIVIYHLGIGGAEQMAVSEIQEFLRRGFKVRLITLCPERPNSLIATVPAACEKECIRFNSLYDWRALRELVRALKRANADIILSHLWFANSVTRVAARIAGAHKRLLIFEENNYDHVKSWKQFLLDRLLQGWCAKIIAVSEGVKQSLVRHGIAEGRIGVIYNAIDISRVTNAKPSEIRAELGIGEKMLYLFVGRLVRQKGVDVLLDAFSKTDDGVLLVVGEGRDRAKLESQAEALGLKSRVFFLGVRNDVPSLMKSADCFVFASRWEGFGVVLVEALAAELPIIGTSVDGIKEVIKDGENGTLVPPEDADAFANALRYVGENDAFRKAVAARGIARARFFSIEKHIDDVCSVLARGDRGAGKIRIALMTSTIDGRQAKGTAVVARKCVEALLEKRDEFEMTYLHYEKTEDPIYKQGVRDVVIPRFRWSFLDLRSFRLFYFFLTTKDRFDIIHWFQPRLYPFFFLAPTRRIVVSVHGTGDLGDNKINFVFSRFVFNWSLILLRRYVSAATAISEFAKNDVVRKYGFSPEQVYAIPNGAEAMFAPASKEEIAAVRKKYGLPDRFFLNIARLIPGKNVIRTLRAFEMFCEESDDERMAFVNVGNKGSEKEAVDALIAQSPVKHRIQLTGYIEQEDLPALYSAAYALVFPLLNEGFGLPVLEAAQCGAPLVIAQTAAPEVTPEDAILVDAYDTRSIADAMVKIAGDAKLHARLRERGLELARTYSWARMQEKIIELYREVAA